MTTGQGFNVSSVKLVAPEELTHECINTHRGRPIDLGYRTSLLKGKDEIPSPPPQSTWSLPPPPLPWAHGGMDGHVMRTKPSPLCGFQFVAG